MDRLADFYGRLPARKDFWCECSWNCESVSFGPQPSRTGPILPGLARVDHGYDLVSLHGAPFYGFLRFLLVTGDVTEQHLPPFTDLGRLYPILSLGFHVWREVETSQLVES
jgi:hypothetical protein